jgi:hypothetical protein
MTKSNQDYSLLLRVATSAYFLWFTSSSSGAGSNGEQCFYAQGGHSIGHSSQRGTG